MPTDIVLLTTRATNYVLLFSKKSLYSLLYTMAARIGNDALQPVHLPKVPGNDVGNVVQALFQGTLAQLSLVVFHKG